VDHVAGALARFEDTTREFAGLEQAGTLAAWIRGFRQARRAGRVAARQVTRKDVSMAAPNRRLQDTQDHDHRPSIREYGIALAIIALIAVVAFIVFGPETETILSTVSHSV
jgi:Sec-independent protein translocase protein TatA